MYCCYWTHHSVGEEVSVAFIYFCIFSSLVALLESVNTNKIVQRIADSIKRLRGGLLVGYKRVQMMRVKRALQIYKAALYL